MDSKVTVAVPGKLYIAGEYAVLENKQPAIIVAVNAFLTCQVSASNASGKGLIYSDVLSTSPLYYERRSLNQVGIIARTQWQKEWAYILSAIEIVEQYAAECDVNLKDYEMRVTSDLQATNGQKYGLGSSGAVTVAVIKSLLQFYQLPYSKLMLYKLAVLASAQVSLKGSYGDIAASVFGSWVYYVAFNREWLMSKLAQKWSIKQLIALEWEQLVIKNIPVAKNIRLHIGWTGQSASTDTFVAQYKEQSSQDLDEITYQPKDIVNQLVDALVAGNISQIKLWIAAYRLYLQQLAHQRKLIIETSALKQLIDVALEHDFASKSSGAGGGDCGIAIGDVMQSATSMYDEWQQHHIMPLPYQVVDC